MFEVGTWKPGPRLGTGELTGFSPDGKIACPHHGPEDYLSLVEVATGGRSPGSRTPTLQPPPAASMTAGRRRNS